MPAAAQGREETNQSLLAEREQADAEIGKRRAAIVQTADAVVDEARRAADETLQDARDTADEKGAEPSQAVLDERALTDDALEKERTGSDAGVRRERDERTRALSSLLRLEREETDQHLFTERNFSDEALSTRDIFLAMVSHDLRTLLGGIALAASLLTGEEGGPAVGHRTVVSRAETIQRLAARMNRLIGDLVDVASIEAGKLLVVPAKANLTSLIREALDIFRPSADARAIHVTAHADGSPLWAWFDRDRLLQVLANLLSNALKFSPRDAAISIHAERDGSQVRVTVADTGPGISAENLEPIFGKFWQVGRRDRRGLGLGLYISRCIVEAHGGRIWAESGPQPGSRFIFMLPAV